MHDIKSTNWNITQAGSFTVILASILFLAFAYLVDPAETSGVFENPLFLSAVSGFLFAFSLRVAYWDKIQMFMKPVSGLLNVLAGAFFVAAMILYFPNMFQVVIEAFRSFSGGSLADLLRAVILPVFGYNILMIGFFLITAGTFLVYWDRVGGRIPIAPEKPDFVFVGILGGLTLFGIFGNAFLSDVSFRGQIGSVIDFILADSMFSGLFSGILIVLTYYSVRWLWISLPIREALTRSGRETYDNLERPEKVVKTFLIPVLGLLVVVQGFVDITVLSVFSVFSSSMMRYSMIFMSAGSILLTLFLKSFKMFAKDRQKLKALIPYFVFGCTVYLLAPVLTGFLDQALVNMPSLVENPARSLMDSVGGSQFVMILMTFSALWAIFLKMSMDILKLFGLIPKGVEGVTIVSTGIFASSIGIYLYTQDTLILFLGVALSLICWELGKRSVILGREIGRSGYTYQSELVQVATKFLAGLFAVVLAIGASSLVASYNFTAPQESGFLIIVLLVVGLVFLSIALKELS